MEVSTVGELMEILRGLPPEAKIFVKNSHTATIWHGCFEVTTRFKEHPITSTPVEIEVMIDVTGTEI
jgi:hypothetical protein